jgi:hypothetical protein
VIQHPLNPASMIAAPCTILTDEQAGYVVNAISGNPNPYHPVAVADRHTCTWRDPNSDVVLTVTWSTSPGTTLADLYTHWSDYSTWSPFTMAGAPSTPAYPGVITAKGNRGVDVYFAVNNETLSDMNLEDPHATSPRVPSSTMRLYAYYVAANLQHG